MGPTQPLFKFLSTGLKIRRPRPRQCATPKFIIRPSFRIAWSIYLWWIYDYQKCGETRISPKHNPYLRRTQCDISIPPQLIQDAINGTIVNLGSAENSRWNELRQNSFQIWSTPRIPANSPLNFVETLEILSLKESFLFKNSMSKPDGEGGGNARSDSTRKQRFIFSTYPTCLIKIFFCLSFLRICPKKNWNLFKCSLHLVSTLSTAWKVASNFCCLLIRMGCFVQMDWKT